MVGCISHPAQVRCQPLHSSDSAVMLPNACCCICTNAAGRWRQLAGPLMPHLAIAGDALSRLFSGHRLPVARPLPITCRLQAWTAHACRPIPSCGNDSRSGCRIVAEACAALPQDSSARILLGADACWLEHLPQGPLEEVVPKQDLHSQRWSPQVHFASSSAECIHC